MQRQLLDQKVQMERALCELQAQQEKAEELALRLAACQWWQRPSSSSTLSWVHSGGAMGTITSEDTREWRDRHEASTLVQPSGDQTINLDITVIDLDLEDPSLEDLTTIQGIDNHLLEGDTLQGEKLEEAEHDHRGHGQGA